MIEIRVDEKSLKNLEQALEGINPKKASSALNKGFKQAALLIERKLKQNISGSLLNVRSGRLRSSIGSVVGTEDGLPVARIGSGVRQGRPVSYAGIHETGGVVRPKTGQFLTVPLKAAQTQSGVTRFTAREVKSGMTNYKASFIRKGIIFGVINKGRSSRESIVPLFVLKRSVTIRPSRYLTITRNETEQEAMKELVAAAEIAVKPKGQE